MNGDRDEQISALIERLTNEVELAKIHSLDVTAHLLRITILDLRLLASSISNAELREFTDALQEGVLQQRKAVGRR